MLLYPRVIECMFHFLCEHGYIKKFKHGDIVAYALQVMVITYSYLFEPDNMTKGFNKTIDTYCVKNYEDKRACLAKAAVVRGDLIRNHGANYSF
jgi:hypothetical protein